MTRIVASRRWTLLQSLSLSLLLGACTRTHSLGAAPDGAGTAPGDAGGGPGDAGGGPGDAKPILEDAPVVGDTAMPPPPPDAADAGDSGTSLLADMLARTWISAAVTAGNCVNISTWYTFGADGSLIERDIDENACSGVMLIKKLTGVYTLRDRVLEMTLNGLGMGTPFLVRSPSQEPVATLTERFPIAAGKIVTPWTGAGHLAIDSGAYTGADGAHFQSQRHLRLDSAAGARLFEQDLSYQVTVTPPLPLAAGQACQVQIDFALVLFDAAATVAQESDTFRITYAAVIRATEDGWMRLVPRPLDGLSTADAYTVWHSMLDSAGLSTSHSARFASTFDRNFVYYLGHPTDDPHVLTQTLPQTGRWLEATRVLPVDGTTADLCTISGGTVGTRNCCTGTGELPNTCTVGACTCAPASSHPVAVCECPNGGCFQEPYGCVGPAGICTVGADQSCNDNLAVSSFHGTCLAGGRCACHPGFTLITPSGKCS